MLLAAQINGSGAATLMAVLHRGQPLDALVLVVLFTVLVRR